MCSSDLELAEGGNNTLKVKGMFYYGVVKVEGKGENAEDIYAEAQQINEEREAAEEVVEDASEEVADFKEEETEETATGETTEEGSEE